MLAKAGIMAGVIVVVVLRASMCASVSYTSDDATQTGSPSVTPQEGYPIGQVTEAGDGMGRESPIEPFTCDLKEYDPTLDPKYVEEDHRYNQARLQEAYSMYVENAREACLAERRLAGNQEHLLRSAEETYNARLREVSVKYDQMRLDDDIKYRVALREATKKAEEDAERKQKMEDAFRERAEQFDNQRRKWAKAQLAKHAAGPGVEDIVTDLETQVESSHCPGQGVVIAPEEFYPERRGHTKITAHAGSPGTLTNDDKHVLLMSSRLEETGESREPSDPGLSAGPSGAKDLPQSDFDRLMAEYEQLVNEPNWSDPTYSAKADSLFAQIIRVLEGAGRHKQGEISVPASLHEVREASGERRKP